uniref:C2H2-type domain-containing protein n=1 Tax=Propithecus coquereli TaxID=379532 RepID=A0A2K6EMS7_PROCO
PPRPRCALGFGKKQQLKLHLLTHGSGPDRRPFKCALEGCGWAFTTSYKLKRHLQSHDKLRPFCCPAGGCGKKFTTVYNLKTHMKAHEQESQFKCDVCAEGFPTHARLSAHQRSHFEPERPYKCDFPGKGAWRTYEKHGGKNVGGTSHPHIPLHGEHGLKTFLIITAPWFFCSGRKHNDDRRFPCPVEGCGKSFRRAEHLKGHSVTHLGTKPFKCPVEGCRARFSARSSLYMHSKKHEQAAEAPKSCCPSCNRLFRSKHSMKAHMARQHCQRQGLLPQLEAASSLTPSSELSGPGQSELINLDLSALFSDAPAGGGSSAGGSDEAPSSGILTIDIASMSSSLGTSAADGGSPGQVDPLVLVAHSDIPPSLDSPLVLGTAATAALPQVRVSVEDVTVSAGPLGCLVTLPEQHLAQDHPPAPSSGDLAAHATVPTSSGTPEAPAPGEVEWGSPPGPEAAGQWDGDRGLPQAAWSGPAEAQGARDTELGAGTGSLYLV